MSGLFLGPSSACNWCEKSSSSSESLSESLSVSVGSVESPTIAVACGPCIEFPLQFDVTITSSATGCCSQIANTYRVTANGALSPTFAAASRCLYWTSAESILGVTSTFGVCDDPAPTRARVTMEVVATVPGTIGSGTLRYWVTIVTIGPPGTGAFGSRGEKQVYYSLFDQATCSPSGVMSFNSANSSLWSGCSISSVSLAAV